MSCTPARAFVVPVMLVAALCAIAGGCSAGENLTHIQGTQQFQQQVLESRQPVLVDFYKNGCPTCVIQEGVLDGLAKEYGGRVSFVKFKIREAYFASSNQEIMDRYHLMWVPTVILFVNGKETKRWTFNHAAEEFRPALDEATGNGKATAAKHGRNSKDPDASWMTLGDASAKQCIEGKGCPINR